MDFVETITIIIFIIVFLFLFFWPISLPLLIYYLYKKNKNRKEFKNMVIDKNNYNMQKEITEDDLHGFEITNIPKLKEYLFEIYKNFEIAYNNIDFNTMYNLCTPKMYNMYHTSIVMNLKFEEKKIIDKINLKGMKITSAYSSDYKQVIVAVLDLSNISYTIKSDGKIVSGSPTNEIHEKFEVTYVKHFDKKQDYRCPNCGANVTGTTCEYCKSTLNEYKDFRIDAIKKIV